jgi:hypothetical protein
VRIDAPASPPALVMDGCVCNRLAGRWGVQIINLGENEREEVAMQRNERTSIVAFASMVVRGRSFWKSSLLLMLGWISNVYIVEPNAMIQPLLANSKELIDRCRTRLSSAAHENTSMSKVKNDSTK